MNLTEAEFAALRQTITSRGTARMVLFPVILFGWATVAGALTAFGESPVGSLFSLAVLSAGFEAVHALHAGVERIGRYIQVFYEGDGQGPKWETTAMAVGPALPGGGIDPLFTPIFASAAIVNLIPVALLPSPTWVSLGVVGALHAGFLIRLVRARGAAARQRAVELESYRAIRSQLANGRGPS